jgi:acetyl-CoA/propionyl-CoA carboxylase, biotin carboxylase, biotin carboxyl carrier protein
VRDPAFVAEDGRFGVYTSWIETEFVNGIEPWSGSLGDQDPTGPAAEDRQHVTVEVNGKRIEVSLPTGLAKPESRTAAPPPPRRRSSASRAGTTSGDAVKAPMQATVVKVAVEEGQHVVAGDLVAVLEAMKMEQPITAHRDGVVRRISAVAGTTVSSGTVLLEILDEVPALA